MATLINQNGTASVDDLTYNKAGTYHANAGSDTIKITGGSGIVVYADSGNNIINVTGGSGHTVKIAVNNADSDKQNGADKLTVNGANQVDGYLGSGKDDITLLYTDGKKLTGALSQIHGGAWGDTFTVGTGAAGYQLYGDAGDDIFNINNGSNIVCWGGAANDTFNVTGGTGIKLRGGDSADVYNVSVAGVDMQLGYGNDEVNVTAGNKQTIKANLGINTINLKAGSNHVITADIDQAASQKVGKEVGYGVDKVFLNGTATYVTANLGDGKDEVNVSKGYGHKIFTEGWGDTINIYGTVSNSTFDAGAGDDIINISGGTSNTIAAGIGNDTIKVSGGSVSELRTTGGQNTIMVSGSAEIDKLYFGNQYEDVKVTGGKINTIYNPNDAQIKFVLEGGRTGSLVGGSKYDNISIKGGVIDQIQAGGGDDDIWYTEGAVGTIKGGLGDDTIYVTTGQGTGTNIYGDEGDDIIVVKTPKEATYTHYIFGGAGEDNIAVSGSGHSVQAGADNDTVTLGDGAKSITVWLEEGDDIAISKDNTEISAIKVYGGNGEDRIELKGYVENSIIFGNESKDTIFVGNTLKAGKNNKLYGDDGNDTISCINNKYALVVGGDGSDSIKCTDITYGVIYGDRHILSDSFACSADTIILTNVSQSYISGSKVAQKNFENDNNTITISGTCNKDIIFGGRGANTLWVNGALSNSILIGGEGNDNISISNVNAKNNAIFGGRGDDTYTITGGSNNTIYDRGGNNIYNISGGSANYYHSKNSRDDYYITSGVQAYNIFHSEDYAIYNVDCNAKVMIETNPGSGALDKINICGASANQVDILVDKTSNIIKINNILIKGTKAWFSFGSSDLHQSGSQEYMYDAVMGLKVGKTKNTASLSGEWDYLLTGMGEGGRAVGITELNASLNTVLEDVQTDINQIYSTYAK